MLLIISGEDFSRIRSDLSIFTIAPGYQPLPDLHCRLQLIDIIVESVLKIMKKLLPYLFFVTCIFCQLSITAVDPVTYTIDFDSVIGGVVNGPFNGSGFQPVPSAGQIDTDGIIATGLSDGSLAWGGTDTAGDFARGTSTGHVGTGGLYAFEVNTGDFALGVQPIGSDFSPGDFILKVTNNTGNTATHFTLSYDVYVYNDQERSNSFNFSYSADDLTYTQVPALDCTSAAPSDALPAWVPNARQVWISNFQVLNGGSFYLKWTGADVDGTGYRDEFALDNITISIGNALDTDLSLPPLRFALSPAFPNPFNPITTISYSLPFRSPVRIDAFDLQGKLARNLLSGELSAGEHVLHWNAAGLPSGTYIIRLSAGGETESRSVTLLK
ncbi:MAG: T9SS type A sorting domain-containing protein [FCB group bacterium]|nr:T9SS type A sorting domain-containing protein [FCB group bacterium]